MGKSQAEKLRNDVEKQLREFEKLDSTSMYFALLAIDYIAIQLSAYHRPSLLFFLYLPIPPSPASPFGDYL
jgi:hypothetical protein